MHPIIDMVECPYCRVYMVQEGRLCCETCEPQINADLVIVEIQNAITLLEKQDRHIIRDRINILLRLADRLMVLSRG